MNEQNEIRANQYFGATLTEEEETELLNLEGRAFAEKLAFYRARTRERFPAVDQRMVGSVSELLGAIQAGRAGDED